MAAHRGPLPSDGTWSRHETRRRVGRRRATRRGQSRRTGETTGTRGCERPSGVAAGGGARGAGGGSLTPPLISRCDCRRRTRPSSKWRLAGRQHRPVRRTCTGSRYPASVHRRPRAGRDSAATADRCSRSLGPPHGSAADGVMRCLPGASDAGSRGPAPRASRGRPDAAIADGSAGDVASHTPGPCRRACHAPVQGPVSLGRERPCAAPRTDAGIGRYRRRPRRHVLLEVPAQVGTPCRAPGAPRTPRRAARSNAGSDACARLRGTSSRISHVGSARSNSA